MYKMGKETVVELSQKCHNYDVPKFSLLLKLTKTTHRACSSAFSSMCGQGWTYERVQNVFWDPLTHY